MSLFVLSLRRSGTHPENEALDKERQETEYSARRARERAREFLLEIKVQGAKRQGWEEGRKRGLEEDMRGGEMDGSRHESRDGTEGGTSCGGLGINDSNMQRPGKPKPAAASATASAETQTYIHPTKEEEDSGEEPIVHRGPKWVDDHVRRSSSCTGPYSHLGSLTSNITDPHLAGES